MVVWGETETGAAASDSSCSGQRRLPTRMQFGTAMQSLPQTRLVLERWTFATAWEKAVSLALN